MADGVYRDGIAAHRLTAEAYADNFGDLHPPLDRHEAHVEADRCYFCYDAPCQTACPTDIDIPMFIRQIAAGNAIGAAKTIFDQNILGGMCARVCPTETLCEEACVRMDAEGDPVKIGQLQRFATDAAMRENRQFYRPAPGTGKHVAVVGAGPAGLACAHRLAMHGHQVVVFDARPKAGGLNEFGIAAYKTVDAFAQAEIEYITAIGGISIRTDRVLGRDFSLADLKRDYDAVFLGAGLGDTNRLGIGSDDVAGLDDAVDFISVLRQAGDLGELPIGRRVVVIGGGMTAIDAAVQSKLLGAEEVTICYRRGKAQMNASEYEQDLATSKGVEIRHWLEPREVVADGGRLTGVVFEYTRQANGQLSSTGETLTLPADQVFVAIGQRLAAETFEGLTLDAGKIKVDADGQTSDPKLWAGGDCATGGDDLTVTAVAQGRDAAKAIHRALTR